MKRLFVAALAVVMGIGAARGAQAPDTSVVTGPGFQQIPLPQALVTPTGGTQGTLGAALGSACGVGPICVATGLTTPNTAIPQSGGAPTPLLNVIGHFTGTFTVNGSVAWNTITINNDSAADTGTNPNIVDFAVNHNFGGTTFSGGRTGFMSNFTQNGAISNGGGETISGYTTTLKANNTWGGADDGLGAAGVLNGLNPSIQFQAGATHMRGGTASEADMSTAAGASIGAFAAYTYVHLASHKTPATYADVAFGAGDQDGAAPSLTAFGAIGGRGGQWPVRSTGGIMKTELGNNFATNPSTAIFGDNYLLADFSGPAFQSNEFRVDGPTGAVRIGTCYLSPSATGMALDCSGSIGTAVAIANGGSSWPTDGNSYYTTDAYDGVYKLTLSGGVVTGITIYRAPHVSGATPSNPISLTPDTQAQQWGATGLTVNLTWTARTALTINPSGGSVTLPTGLQRLYSTGTSVGNGADTTEDILQSYTIPAAQLVNVGDTIHIVAGGTLAASTDTKTIRVKFGGVTVANPTANLASQVRWYAEAWITKTGVNTQSWVAVGTNITGSAGTSSGTATVTDTNAIAVQVTGQNSTNAVAGSLTAQVTIVDYEH